MVILSGMCRGGSGAGVVLARQVRRQSTRAGPIESAALIAWMLVVRVDDLVKDGAKRRRLRRSTILDKIINANRVLSKRSRPLSGPSLQI
jgi:hypothetical protein